MGVIKKLKGKDLVGWQLNPGVDVYPITHIGAVFNDLNVPLSDILDGLQLQISGGGSSASTYPINYLWAYTTARTDSEALSKLNRSELVDVPTNFVGNTSFTVPDGYYIYMTTARNQGGVYLRWEDNSIWSVPVRIGSGYTTSYTGNDGEGYNYAYCRTNNATPPNIPASLTVVRLNELSDNQGISASDGSISLASFNVWYDHPLGVDGTYLWEWVAISRGSDGAGWSVYTGPTLWSKFGVDGRDGDGIEYIFTALAEDAPTPLFMNKYNGRIGEQSSDYQEVLIENCTSDSFYQQDDFIPSGWHDTPLALSYSYNKQYVSVRKKRFTNENEGYWGPFSLPVLWSKISNSAITMTLDNDAIILDANTSSESTKIVSCTGIHIWNGDKEITTDPNYYIEILASPINSINDILVLRVVSWIEGDLVYTTYIQDPDYSSGYGYNFIYPVDTFKSSLGMMFCLSRLDDLTAMNEGSYAIGYKARIYNRNDRTLPIAEITKALSVQIVNINNGTSYMMQVSPNSLPVSRVNSTSQYTFTGDNQIDITVKACSGTRVTPCNIYNSNQGDGKLYVTVIAYNAQGPTSVEYAGYSSGNGSDTISYTLTDAGNNCLYYIVNLYYVSEGVAYLVETETVDLVKKGDDGTNVQGLRGAVVRNRGEWKSDTTYCYNTDMEGNGPSDNNIVYIDIVYYNGNYYQCISHHTSTSSSAPGNALYWTVALNFEFIATKVLAADAADILVLSGGSVVVKDNSLTIVGGMTGGTLAATNDVIIWAGGSAPNLSTFKVYEDGSFNFGDGLFIWAKTGVTLGTTLKYEKSSGNTTIGSYWDNLTLPLIQSDYIILCEETNSSVATINKITSSVSAGRALFEVNAEGDRRILLYAGTASQGTLHVEVNDGSGWGKLTTTGASTSSDIRLKENFVDFLLTLEQMANSPLFKFNFKGHRGLLQVGTSALYWEPIIPEAISKKYNNRDKNEYLGLNYANVAFAAAISLAKEVKLLKEEVERLKSLLQQY